jgi:hypothetical protein
MHVGEQRRSSVHPNALTGFVHRANGKEDYQYAKEAPPDDPHCSMHPYLGERVTP